MLKMALKSGWAKDRCTYLWRTYLYHLSLHELFLELF